MKRVGRSFLAQKIDIFDACRALAILATILMVITFFAGCATKKDQADSNSVIREAPGGHEVHGEVGAAYGRGF